MPAPGRTHPHFVCIGGAAVDRKLRLAAPPVLGTSNPARATASFGGVARNVAENLARLGAEVAFVSAVGADADGRALLGHLAGLGVDVTAARLIEGATTAQYIAALNPDGSLAFGLADLGVLDAQYGDLVASLPALEPGAVVFADCNAPAEGLAAVLAQVRAAGARLAVDAISTVKVRRLPPRLDGVAILFLNLDEARSLLDESAAPARDLAARLLARGAEAVVLTLGAEGALAATMRAVTHVPAEPAQVADVTGAGDSMIAGTLFGLAQGLDLAEAVRLGAHIAARTVATGSTVDAALSPEVARSFLTRAELEIPS